MSPHRRPGLLIKKITPMEKKVIDKRKTMIYARFYKYVKESASSFQAPKLIAIHPVW